MKTNEIKKAKTVCLRFVKSGNITVDTPDNWENMTDNEKGIWANVQLEYIQENDYNEIYDSLKDDEEIMCEAIENVENGYTADIPYTNLWKAYRGEDS